MNGSIYVIRNDVNQKLYVGQTTMPVKERFKRHLSCNPKTHNQAILWAIRKHGKEHFWVETLETGVETEEELNRLEEEYIAKMNTMKPNGYNLCPGGGQWRNPNNRFVIDRSIVEDYLSGMSLRAVAAKHGCCATHVKKNVLAAGESMRKNHNPYSKHASELTEELLRELFLSQGKTDQQIADAYGLGCRWVRRRRQNFGIHRI